MNTILITGTAQTIPVKISPKTTGFKVEYDIYIWGANECQQLQLITCKKETMCGYGDLWNMAKNKAASYFNEPLFNDGAYTQYLDHLIIK